MAGRASAEIGIGVGSPRQVHIQVGKIDRQKWGILSAAASTYTHPVRCPPWRVQMSRPHPFGSGSMGWAKRATGCDATQACLVQVWHVPMVSVVSESLR